MNQYHRTQMTKKQKMTVAGVILAVLMLVGGVGYGIKVWEDRRYRVDDIPHETSGPFEKEPLKTLEYGGKKYIEREGLRTYLIMGIDRMNEDKKPGLTIGGDQADVQMVLVVDEKKKTWQTLQINRDTMAEVYVLAMSGQRIGTSVMQIAMAHSYGDGKEQSCENTVDTVSLLLGEQKIHGYVALDMEAVGVINDMLGGVTVQVISDMAKFDPALTVGATVTLNAKQALTYVRARHGVDDETNLARMERQRSYMTAMERQVKDADAEFALRTYDALHGYMVTNMGSGTVSEIYNQIKKYTKLPMLQIEGENKVLDAHWAYYLDEKSKMETILALFYEEQR